MKVDRHEGRPRAVADFMQDVEPTVEAADGDAADGPAQERIRPPKRPLDDDSSAVSRVTLSPDLLPLLLRGVPTRDLPVVARVCTFWGLAVPIALDERRAIELERVVPLTADTNAPVTQEEALLRRTEAAAAGKWFRASMVDHCVHIFPEEQLSEQAFRSAAVRGGGVRDRLQPVGRKLGCIGGRGSAPGHFLDPSGVAVSDTHLIVADAGNHRLQFFTFEGWHVRCVGVQRTADAPPSPGGSAWPAAWFPAAAAASFPPLPAGVDLAEAPALPPGFGPAGAGSRRRWPSHRHGHDRPHRPAAAEHPQPRFQRPKAVAVGHGRLYALDRQMLQVLTMEGRPLQCLRLPLGGEPLALCIDGPRLLVLRGERSDGRGKEGDPHESCVAVVAVRGRVPEGEPGPAKPLPLRVEEPLLPREEGGEEEEGAEEMAA